MRIRLKHDLLLRSRSLLTLDQPHTMSYNFAVASDLLSELSEKNRAIEDLEERVSRV